MIKFQSQQEYNDVIGRLLEMVRESMRITYIDECGQVRNKSARRHEIERARAEAVAMFITDVFQGGGKPGPYGLLLWATDRVLQEPEFKIERTSRKKARVRST